jgi:hypothetical protein
MSRSSKWSVSFRFSHQNLVCTSSLCHELRAIPILFFLIVSLNIWYKTLNTIDNYSVFMKWEAQHHIHKSSNLYLLNVFHTFVSYPLQCCPGICESLCIISGLFSYKCFSTKMWYACFLQAAWLANTLADLISLLIVDEKYEPELTT